MSLVEHSDADVARDFDLRRLPGDFFDDPNVTDKKFPGNPTRSYRSREPLRIVREVLDWVGHSPEEIQAMKDAIVGKAPIDD